MRKNLVKKLAAGWITFAAFLAAWMGPQGFALAQEFQKVEGPPRQEVPAVPFVAIAYGIIWVAILTYVLVVARGVGRVNRELAELERKLGGGTRP
jgi:CcmD family protein